jgi:nucleoside-diphosphate-sugar epimerase
LTYNSPVVIVGPGYTGSRLALRLTERKIPVFIVARDPQKLARLSTAGIFVSSTEAFEAPQNGHVVYFIPPLPDAEAQEIRRRVTALHPNRLIYISSTGVYGNQTKINAQSVACGGNTLAQARIAEETWWSAGAWSTLILRPAAIYGPGRGVHVRVARGQLPRGTGSQVTSRIHVDDLVRLIEAGLDSSLEGAWPVADELPCATQEIIDWCLQHISVDANVKAEFGAVHAGRIVDGSAIFRALGVSLLWPSWKTGIPACLREERAVS